MILRWIAGALAGLALLAAPAQAQVTVDKAKVHSPSVAGNLEGNSADREVFVILPASYAKSPGRRYPVLYFLHGFTATAAGYMDYLKFGEAMAATGAEMIVVVPDSYTRHGGSMYSNSPTVGDFEGFIARDLVAWVDGKYRTLAKRESRGLAGHSMGGYGTLKIGMKYPQVFSSLYAMSSCCLSPRTASPAMLKPLESITVDQAVAGDFLTRANFAVAAAWSPAPDKPPFFADIGLDKQGQPDPLVFAKWAANAPLAMLPQYLPALRSMTAIALDVGDKDFLLSDNQAIHAELTRFGIVHGWTLYDGDHGNRIPERFRQFVLPFFAQHLAAK